MLGRTFICTRTSYRTLCVFAKKGHVLRDADVDETQACLRSQTFSSHPKTTGVSRRTVKDNKTNYFVEKHFIGCYSLKCLCLTTFTTIKKCCQELLFILFFIFDDHVFFISLSVSFFLLSFVFTRVAILLVSV